LVFVSYSTAVTLGPAEFLSIPVLVRGTKLIHQLKMLAWQLWSCSYFCNHNRPHHLLATRTTEDYNV